MSPMNPTVARAFEWLKLGLEIIAGVLIATGAVVTVAHLVRRALTANRSPATTDRLALARYLSWALEFQLAADILDTAIAPEWQTIGKVAAIAAIRTALNYALTREMTEDRARIADTVGMKSNRDAALAK